MTKMDQRGPKPPENSDWPKVIQIALIGQKCPVLLGLPDLINGPK